MGECVETVKITNERGLHARAASEFVKLSGTFQSKIYVTKDEQEVNGKSIMGILMLIAACGTSIQIRAVGDDADVAVQQLVQLVEDGFYEQDE